MSVITASKTYDDIHAALSTRGDLQVVGLGCDYQILLLSCGAGLKCVRDALPGVRLVPGLDTLDPGAKGELACLACGRCEFAEAGCRMHRLAEEQARRLSRGYPES